MQKNLIAILIASAATISNVASATDNYKPAFDPSGFKAPTSSVANEVMVLGTAHLSALPDQFSFKNLDLVIERLASWKPQVITIEALSGTQCDHMRRYPTRYAESITYYCWNPEPARVATGLDVPAAYAEMQRLLAKWPASPSAAQRRNLAAVFLAAGERASALVQWLRLPTSERRAQDGLDDQLVKILDGLIDKRNEDFQIAAPLAAKLGLERVYATDDHTADSPNGDDEAADKAAGEIMKSLWTNPASAKRHAESDALQKNLGNPEGVLAMFRAYNQADQGVLVYHSDFGAALKDQSTLQIGRIYVGNWETRNLRMVAHIRDIIGLTPGKRTLSIVGAAHKGYFEAYLNMMHDVKLVDVAPLLR